MTDSAPLSQLTQALLDSVASGEFVRLSIGAPMKTAGDLKSIDIRPIMVKRVLRLSFTYHHQRRDVVKNVAPQEAAVMVIEQLEKHFRHAYLSANSGDLQLVHAPSGYRLKRHAAKVTAAPELSHDRTKQRLVGTANKPYLHALGLTDAKGSVYKNAQDKFRQINKYIEILDGLIRALPPKDSLRIIDMGAGKGYLTFALYDHLTHTVKRNVHLVGVEFRAELVEHCNEIAANAGFSGLSFVEGSIENHDCTGADAVIALHACDTATDEAIAKAIRAQAALIVVAPCCHKQIRRAMGTVVNEHPLAPLMRHGTYVERIGEMVTDGLRAQLMELAGYKTKLFEFISDAHTPKNIMIVATRTKPLAPNEAAKLRRSIAKLKQDFGIHQHALEKLLVP